MISLSVLLAPTTILHMLAGFLLVSLVFVFGTLLGALMPVSGWLSMVKYFQNESNMQLDITSGGLYLYLMTMGIYMLSLYFLVLYSVLGVTWGFYVFAVSIACVVLVVRTSSRILLSCCPLHNHESLAVPPVSCAVHHGRQNGLHQAVR